MERESQMVCDRQWVCQSYVVSGVGTRHANGRAWWKGEVSNIEPGCEAQCRAFSWHLTAVCHGRKGMTLRA